MPKARALCVAVLVAVASACGGGPSSPTAPTPNAISLSGTVTAAGARLTGATVTFLDGPNVGKTATTVNGDYRFENALAGNANISVTATGYLGQRVGVSLFAPLTRDFSLITPGDF